MLRIVCSKCLYAWSNVSVFSLFLQIAVFWSSSGKLFFVYNHKTFANNRADYVPQSAFVEYCFIRACSRRACTCWGFTRTSKLHTNILSFWAKLITKGFHGLKCNCQEDIYRSRALLNWTWDYSACRLKIATPSNIWSTCVSFRLQNFVEIRKHKKVSRFVDVADADQVFVSKQSFLFVESIFVHWHLCLDGNQQIESISRKE